MVSVRVCTWCRVCVFVDELHLKIPWRNLYGAPVVAEVVGLYVVAGPASGAVPVLTASVPRMCLVTKRAVGGACWAQLTDIILRL